MSDTREQIVVDEAYQLGYDEMREIVAGCGGWIRESGGAEGDPAKVWHGGKEYVFSGRGLVDFLYAVKDKGVNDSYAAIDLCDCIAKAATEPPSVFVRDAIVARAATLKAKLIGEAPRAR